MRKTYDYSLLPPHIIGDIMEYLNNFQLLNASQTCKSWYFESLKPKLNRNIRVRLRLNDVVPEELDRPFGILLLQQIDFSLFHYKNFLVKHGHNIHDIELEYCTFSLDQLIGFLVYLPNLSTFKIKSSDTNFSDDMNSIETNQDIIIVKSNFERMSHIEIILSRPDEGGLNFIMSLMPNLKVISIGNQKPCTSYIFKILFDYLKRFDTVNLERLSISDMEGANVHQFFIDFSNIMTHLNVHTVTLGMISSSSYETYYEENFTNFCQKLSRVTKFTIKAPRDCHFSDICRYMSNLQELHLTYAAIKHFRGIECLTNLEKLYLTCTVCYRGCYDENEFIAMFTKLQQLKELSINLYPITDRVLNAMCKHCNNLTSLEILRSKTCNFGPIFKYLIKLKSLRLHLSALVNYTQFDVECDITNLKFLDDLDINAFVPGLTLELIERLPNLKAASFDKIKSSVFTKYGLIN